MMKTQPSYKKPDAAIGGIRGAIGEFFARLSVFRRPAPVNSAAAFGEFMATRSAYVAQKKLYEYVKTRMGLSYPRHFENDEFIASLNIAKWHVYAAAMSDLAVWMGGQVYSREGIADDAAGIVRHFYHAAVAERFREELPGEGVPAILASFDNRLALTDWSVAATRDHAFTLSPKELVRWAPIAPELKKYDVEIVENSIRFSWVAVRAEFSKLYEHEAVLADWQANYAGNDPD